MKKQICLMAVLGFVWTAVAAGVVTWTGQGADNKWATKENWDPQCVPTHTEDIHFPSGNWTVEPGSGRWYGQLTLDDGAGAVTFVGGSMLRATSATLTVGDGRELIVDGCSFPVGGSFKWTGATLRVRSGEAKVDPDVTITLGGSCRVCVEGGFFGNKSSKLWVTNSAALIVSGGLVHLQEYCAYGSDVPGESGGLIRITGGVLRNDYDFAYTSRIRPGGHFEFLGGTLQWGASSASGTCRLSAATDQYASGSTGFAGFLPPVGGVLNIPTRWADDSNDPKRGALDFYVSGDYSFGGTVIVTNATEDVRSACVAIVGTPLNISGGATWTANAIRAYQNTTQYLDLRRVNLGAGGLFTKWTVYMHFQNGIVFGAWGDWGTTLGQWTYLYLEGPVTFDTLDCLDGTTPRSITMTERTSSDGSDRIVLTDVTELRAVGGGTVTLSSSSPANELRLVEVGSGTTLGVGGAGAKLKAANVSLGANATLKLDLSAGGYLDAAATAVFGAGSKLVVTALPATLTEGCCYPICMVPAKKDGTPYSFPAIELPDDVPTGWSLAYRANGAYLTDGIQPATEGRTTPYWTGAGEDNLFGTAANWSSTFGNSGSPHFYGSLKTEIKIGTAERKVGALYVHDNAAPYVFSGGNLLCNLPYDEPVNNGWAAIFYSLRNNANLPMVVENNVGMHGDAAIGLLIQSYQQGSLSVLGDSLSNDYPLMFGGDVRLGGAWTTTKVGCRPNYGASRVARLSSLTVMPGATLTVTAQSGSQLLPGSAYPAGDFFYVVGAGGAMTVGGTDFTFEHAATHFIDGTLTVNCPLVATAAQKFAGNGTLRFAQATGDIALEGALTLVPDALAGTAAFSAKGDLTLAPEADWSYEGEPSLAFGDNTKLTLATGGRKVTFATPVVSDIEVAVTGGGQFVLGTAGSALWSVSCADGATVDVTDGLLQAAPNAKGYSDILAVRSTDGLVLADTLKAKMRYESETDSYIISAKRKQGLCLIVR